MNIEKNLNMKEYIISVWNNTATLFQVIEDDVKGNEKLEYKKVKLPKNYAQEIQKYINSLVDDLTINKIYPLTDKARKKLKEMNLEL